MIGALTCARLCQESVVAKLPSFAPQERFRSFR